ncbi:DHA2 family efflux MFS transporter permease subunit [Nakamurella flava]|uniref:DHA2 family efflux MFS transporter permease subunit n=1 Tax=Nakamurella flava TaxID=2576308 RepID=A0A4U6QNC5_9ACTN|nr:DHA2 family efflux MFS transporter permease subunit [Nakamurella flava]TKV61562.1 DHA2 family efflux MFS transporter permease subunit [Nakamurella flava]
MTTTAPAGRNRWIGLIGISLAVALIIVDSTIVNVAVPSIVRDLTLSSTEVQWVQESYTLVFAATLLVWGALADRYGRRRILLTGTALFLLASVLCAVSPTGALLIGARVVQGIGGAMMLPTTLSLINATFTGRERGIAFAVWGSTIGGMAAVGPLLGGWLTTAFSWRWAFGINLPIGLAIIALVVLFVPESRGEHTTGVDWVGALLTTVGFGLLAFGLIEGRQYGWWTSLRPLSIGSWSWSAPLSPIPVAFAVCAIALVVFVVRAQRRTRAGRPSLIDPGLFSISGFRNGNVAALIVSLGEFGILLSLPIWLQNVLGYSALQTGLVLLGLAVGSFAASGLSVGLPARIGAVGVVRIGIAAEIVGIGLVVSPTTGWPALVAFLFVYGFGVGLATAQLTGVVLADVPVRRSGEGSGISSTARQVGSALGIAVLGTVLFVSAGNALGDRLTDQGLPTAAADQLVNVVVESAGGAIGQLAAAPDTAAVADAAKTAFSDGTSFAAYVAAGFLVVGLLATLALPNRRPDPVGRAADPAAVS